MNASLLNSHSQADIGLRAFIDLHALDSIHLKLIRIKFHLDGSDNIVKYPIAMNESHQSFAFFLKTL